MVHLKSRLLRRVAVLATVPLVVTLAWAHGASAKAQFPVTVKAGNGSVTIRHRPTRIVSLSPASTQDLFALGAGKQVVAVDSYSTYPPAAPVTKLSGYTPNVEAIAKYHPDLVIVYVDNGNIISQLAKLHIPALLEPAAASLSDAYAQLRQIGEATGHAGAAASVVATMQRKVSAAVHSVPKLSKPLGVYIETGVDPLYSATSNTFQGRILALFGLRNIADAAGSNPYPSLSSEYIVAHDPDLIVLTDIVCCGQSTKTVTARPGWKSIAAVKDGAVLAVNDSIAAQWGPRIVVFVQDIANEIRALERKPR